MTSKENQAIDLLIEDLHTHHHEIRIIAKTLECEQELEKIKTDVLEYLHQLKVKNND